MAASGHIFDSKLRSFIPIKQSAAPEFWEASLHGPLLAPHEWAKIGHALLPTNSDHPCSGTLLPASSGIVVVPRMYGGAYSQDVPTEMTTGLAKYPDGTYGFASTTVGQTSGLRIHPEEGIVIAIGLTAAQPFVRDYILSKLMNAFLPRDLERSYSCAEELSLSLEELPGTYQGRVNGSFRVTVSGSDVILKVGHNPNMRIGGSIVLTRHQSGRLVPKNDLAFLSIGFFRAPDDGLPCITMAGSVFRKLR
jgi:hypothetical protein